MSAVEFVTDVCIRPFAPELLRVATRTELASWVQRSFADNSCVAVDRLTVRGDGLQARLRLRTNSATADERALLRRAPADQRLLASYAELQFVGAGACVVDGAIRVVPAAAR